jgi:hypothetical protein
MDKIPFNEAARLAGIHLNTLRNWQKAGKLKTAEKIIENGRELWIVDPSEVESLSSQHVKKIDTNTADSIDTNNAPPGEPGPATSPAFEQSLALIRESVVRPLTDLVASQNSRIEELSLELGELRAELRHLKAQAGAQPASEVESNTTPNSAREEALQPAQPPKKRRWWQF